MKGLFIWRVYLNVKYCGRMGVVETILPKLLEVVFYLLLGIFGPEVGGGMVAKMGGPRLVLGDPELHDEILVPPPSSSSDNLAVYKNMPSGGTVLDSLKTSLVNEFKPYGIDIQKKHFLHLFISNKQEGLLELGMAKRVFAKLKFYDLNKKTIGKGIEFDGRWGVSDQPSQYQNVEKLRFKDIGQGDKQPLDIAVRDKQTGYWYVWNSENYNSNDPDKRLPIEGFIFSVKLRGTNCKHPTVWYKFVSAENRGARMET